MLAQRKDLVYLLAGAGPMEQRVRELVRHHSLSEVVTMLGAVSDRDILASLYNAADVFVMPNIDVSDNPEAFGIVLLEATSCGVPVVAAKTYGIPDAIAHGKNGLLIEPGDGPGFADAVVSLLDHRQELSTAAVREYTLRTYEWNRLMERYQRQFERLIDNAACA